MLPTSHRRGEMSPFDMIRDLDRMMGRSFGDWESTTASYPCDIHETSENLIVEAELPGFTKEDIDVSVEQGVLTITAQRDEPEKEGEQHLHERTFRRVQRRFALPTSVDPENVDAHLGNGVLTLTMPKRAEVRPRKIEVK